ncbi:hypothetical protein E4T47_05980 [Aureobasidium subglaciale]|nr:hypothetical protein E4T47_05980 [Aureobasidium subglaciale]
MNGSHPKKKQLEKTKQQGKRRDDKKREKQKEMWTTRGSNPRPSACKADALPLRQTPSHDTCLSQKII